MSKLEKGAVIAGKYRLESLIGRGGMGSVWVAHHLQLTTDIALKFIDPLADAGDARARFEREAQAAAQIRSPHVVQILDYGVDGDQPYIAMELLEGEDLGERLRREKRLSVKAAATILTQAAKALRRAHDVGVIHRDLKPSNIFLARFDEDEVVKLLDFGVAKIRNPGIDTGSEFTQTGVIFGSPAYMSPEQARGVKVIDHRSDLWSLAVILYRALTGEKPFEAASIGDLVIKLCIDPLPVASACAPDLSPEIDAFFLKAFARELNQRFSSAIGMAADFEAIAARSAAPMTLGTTVVMEPPPGPTPRSQAAPLQAAPAARPAPPTAPIAPIAQPPAYAPHPPPVAWSAPAAILPPPAPPALQPVTGALTGPFPAPPPMPSVTPQPPSRTPSPTLRAVTPSAPTDPKRLILWTALGGGAVVLLALIIGVSRSRHSPEPIAEPIASTTTVAAAPPPEEPAPAAAPPQPSAEPNPPEPSAAPDPTGVPEEPTTEPTATASASAAPFGRPPRPGGKGGKGRVPNFGY